MLRCWALILLCLSLLSGAQRPGCVFLLIWPGARATAMAGAFSAVVDDATSCYYNPAGLSFIENTIVSLQHVNWLPGLHPDMYYEYGGFVRPWKRGTFGLHVIYLTTGKTPVINSQGQYLGEYTTFDIAAGIDYGTKLGPNLGFGMGWKFIYSFLVPDWVFKKMPELGIEKGGTGITYGFDAGILYTPVKFISLAGVLQNIGPNISYTEGGSSDPLPYTLRLGLKINTIDSRIVKIIFTTDITKVLVGMFAQEDKTFMENLSYELKEAWKGFGLEINYYNFVLLRGGYFYDSEGARKGLTFGGGIKAGGFSLDIGVDEAMYEFPTRNRKFSLTYQF
ncbi:MAG: PorV/PorQ family protein [candidate division WOR-3 bacterium]